VGDRQLKDWVTAYVEYCDQLETPRLYKPWIALSTIASVLGRGVWLPWHSKVYKGFDTFPNLYLMLVAPSGIRKSTGMGPAKVMLRDMEIALTPDSCTWQGLIQKWSTHEVTDRGNPMVAHSSELATFLKQESKLSKMHDQLTHIYDNPHEFEYLLVTREFQIIIEPCLNILGATTPAGLKKCIPHESSAEGLLGRFIPLYGDSVEKKVVRAKMEDMKDEHLLEKLMHDLAAIGMKRGPFEWKPDFYEAYEKWRLEEDNPLPEDFGSPLMSTYQQRRATYLHKLSMLLCLSEQNAMILDRSHFYRAKRMLEDVEQTFRCVFQSYGSDYAVAMNDLCDFMKEKRRCKRSELYSRVLTVQPAHLLTEQLDAAEMAGLIRIHNIGDSPHDKMVVYTGDEDGQHQYSDKPKSENRAG
jgi:hypothetical protein